MKEIDLEHLEFGDTEYEDISSDFDDDDCGDGCIL